MSYVYIVHYVVILEYEIMRNFYFLDIYELVWKCCEMRRDITIVDITVE